MTDWSWGKGKAARSQPVPVAVARGYPRQMIGPDPSSLGDGHSPAEWRRLRRRTIESRERWLAERVAFLDSSLEPGEQVIARSRNHPVVTDRRILDATQRRLPPHTGDWILDPLRFADVTGWSLGRRHDRRPLLRLEHHQLIRIEHVPARRFLWFRWGNAEGPVTHSTTSMGFGRDTNPVLVAILAEVEGRKIPQGQSFEIRPACDRAERIRRTHGPLDRGYRRAWIRPRLWRIDDVAYAGRLGWPVRLLSWMLLGVPAWIITPWLVVPAIAASELVWIVFMQWTWRRTRARQRDTISQGHPGPAEPTP